MSPSMTEQLNEVQTERYTYYKKLQEQVFGEEHNNFPNTHFTRHFAESIADYGPLKFTDCESDEVKSTTAP